MKLLSLRLKNFRQHIDTLLEFKDGITGIIGVNGAGKSTIIEGVIFALYGAKKVRGRSDEIRTYGINSKEVTYAELCFMHSDQVYLAYRDLNTARLQVGSHILAEGQKVVSDRIEQLLKMSFDEFAAAYCTEQKSLEFLSVRQGAAERERFIAEMLGYDKIEKIQELIRQDRRNLKNEINGLEAGLGAKEPILEKLENEKIALQNLKNIEAELVKSLQIREKEEQRAKEALLKLQQNYAPYTELKDKLRLQEVRATENNRRSAQLEGKLKEFNQKMSVLLAEFEIKDSQTALSAYQQLESEALQLKERLRKLNEEKYKTEQLWQAALQKINSENAVQQARVAELLGRLKDITELKESGDCPTCGQKLGDEFKRIRDFLSKELKKEENKLTELKNKLTQAKKEPAELTENKSQIVETEKHISANEIKAKKIQSVMVEINDSIRINTDLDALNAESAEITKQIERIITKMEELKFSEDEFAKARNLFETSEKLHSRARLQRVEHDGKVREQEAMQRRTQEELERYDQQSLILTLKKKEFNSITEADGVLTDFRSALNAAIRPRLADIASEYLAELSDGRYSTVQIGEDFAPAVYENGYLKSVLSGGEEDLLNVCLRLSLSTLIAERSGHAFSLLLMDEIFGSLDENRRQNVLSLLQRLQNRFEQIILITHLDDIKDAVRHLIYINYDESSGALNAGSNNLNEDLAVNI